MLMTVDKCALLMIFFHGSFYLNCCHVKKMTHGSFSTFNSFSELCKSLMSTVSNYRIPTRVPLYLCTASIMILNNVINVGDSMSNQSLLVLFRMTHLRFCSNFAGQFTFMREATVPNV